MKKAAIGIYLATLVSVVWASCTTSTMIYQGRMVTCTTCCNFGNCTTTCM